MTATLAGDYDRAIMAGHSALQKQPRYNPALRYLMVAHSARGERDKAEALRDRLLLSDPNFRDDEVQRLRFGRRVIETAAPVQFHLRKLFNE
jgi:tetratricopeptide (TPR) repeat protein